jgi:hypothetical protein
MATSLSNQAASFRLAFEALGYKPIIELHTFERGDRWYKHDLSTDMVVHVAFLEYKPISKAYAVKVGVSNPTAMYLLRKSIFALGKYVQPVLLSGGGRHDVSDRPCWTLFDCGVAQKWRSVNIPDSIDRSSWPGMLEDLVNNFLRPVFWSIKEPEGVQNLLLNNNKPLEWWGTNGALRAAEIVALSKVTNTNRKVITSKLNDYKKMVERDIYGSKNFEKMLEELFVAIDKA